MDFSLDKSKRFTKAQGLKGWWTMLLLLGVMCYDQFVLQIPFANVVFPILVISAVCLSPAQNIVLVLLYSTIFELSCIGWLPLELYRAHKWLLAVFIGYMMPFICQRLFNRKRESMSTISYASLAFISQMAYYLVSVVATAIIWNLPLGAYLLSDIPYELAGCLATFACTLPIAAIYKYATGELVANKKQLAPRLAPQF